MNVHFIRLCDCTRNCKEHKKQKDNKKIWNYLGIEETVENGVYGHIPNKWHTWKHHKETGVKIQRTGTLKKGWDCPDSGNVWVSERAGDLRRLTVISSLVITNRHQMGRCKLMNNNNNNDKEVKEKSEIK